MIRRFALAMLMGGVVFCAPQDPAPAAEPLPKAETILDRYVEVTGGKAAYQKRRNEVASGVLELKAQNIKGSVTRYSAEPALEYLVLDIEGVGKVESGMNGEVAWEKSSMMGPRIKSGEEKAQAMREGAFNAPIKWREMYQKAETTGVESIDGQPCYVVVVSPAQGKPLTMYFQKKSGLVMKTTTIAVSQMGEIPFESVAEDYKSFGGVTMPTKITQKAGGQEFSITIQSVKVNEELPADRFAPPAEVKALLNKAAPAAEKK
jgi:hypothetical protein